MDPLGQLERIDTQLEYQKSPEQRVALLEQAIRIAEQLQLTDRLLDHYNDLMDQILYSHQWELMFVYFPRLIKILDEKGDELRLSQKYSILFKYKWLINNSIDFPQLSLDRLHQLCDDFETRLKSENASLRPLYIHRACVHLSAMNYVPVQELMELWEIEPRGLYDDCLICDLSSLIDFNFKMGLIEEGMEVFESLISDHQSCYHNPNYVYPVVARHYLVRGEVERAHTLYQEGWTLIQKYARKNFDLLDHCIAAHRGDLDRVMNEFKPRFTEILVESKVPANRMFSLAWSIFSLECLLESGITHLDVEEFRSQPQLLWESDGLSLVSARTCFEQEMKHIGKAFDRRNRHTLQSESLLTIISGQRFREH